MAGRSAVLKIDVLADSKGANKTLDSTSSKLGKVGKVGLAVAAGVAAAGYAAFKVGSALIKAGEAASTSNARIENINKSMGLFGKEAGAVSDRLIKLAETTARQTGVDQNSIKATQAKLLTFKELAKTADVAGGAFDRANMAALDLAAAGFGSAEMNAAQLGKALNDPIKGLTSLTRSGVTFTAAEKTRIQTLVESNKTGQAQELILAAIEKQVGGTAKATANSSDRMKVAFSQVKEKIGGALLPAFNKASGFLLDKVFPAAQKVGKQLVKDLGPAFATVGKFITQKIVPAAQAFIRWFMDKIVPGVRATVTPILQGLQKAFGHVMKAIDDNRPAINKLMNAIRPVVEFIANKVAPVVGKVLGKAFEGVGKAIGVVINIISGFINGISAAVEWVQRLIDRIKDSAFGKAVGAIGRLFGSSSGGSTVNSSRGGPPPGFSRGAGGGPGGFGLVPVVHVGGPTVIVEIDGQAVRHVVREETRASDARTARRIRGGTR